ncbi:MAG: SWIM zinc finger family protein [Hyphomicrobiaceae bacterium]
MPTPVITAAAIRALSTPESFGRGQEYERMGAVSGIVSRGSEVSAQVEGSEIDPYRVKVRMSDGGVADATCNCPYEWGGYCKHIVAVLLHLAEHPKAVTERAPTADLLAKLDKARLLDLLQRRLDVDETLADWIDLELATEVAKADGSKTRKGRRTPVDTSAFRQQVKSLIGGRYRRRRYWDDWRATGNHEELERLVQKAVPFLENGDGRNALRVLEAITEELVDGWLDQTYLHDEDMYLLFDDIARMIAEAALMSDLEADARDALSVTVEDWHQRLSEYGIEDAFPVAIRALESGWDDPALEAVLSSKGRSWPPAGRSDAVESRLTAVRLRVLEGANRSEEYLRLSKVAGAHTEHTGMLARLGRIADAKTYGKKRLKAPSEALALAKVLREAGEDDASLDIAEAGLDLNGVAPGTLQRDEAFGTSTRPHGLSLLAHWLRDYAGAFGRPRVALKAALVGFKETHSLEDFRAAETWAKAKGSGSTWAKVRPTLLADLAAAPFAHDRTLIYLEEGLIGEAVASAGEPSDYAADRTTLMRLAEAAAASHSDWVVRFAVGKAANIMDNNRASHYEEAAQWLQKAALAYEASGREDNWAYLIETLIDKHRRKYKLRPLLEALR